MSDKIPPHPGQMPALIEALRLWDQFSVATMAVDHVCVVALAAETGLTAHDASYLWLSRRLGAVLGTLDRKLARVAQGNRQSRGVFFAGIAVQPEKLDRNIHGFTLPNGSGMHRRSAMALQREEVMHGFISYAHDDFDLFVQIRKHLAATERAFDITCWADESINAGHHWDARIEHAIAKARLFILLLSPAYLNSRYIREREIPAITTRAQEANALICPVVLTRCAWDRFVGSLQVSPTRGRRVVPIVEWQPVNNGYDQARIEIETAIRSHFGIAPTPTDWFTPLLGAQEEQPGPIWLVGDEQFDTDPSGSDADAVAATDPKTRQFHGLNHTKAATFAAKITRLANSLGQEWDGFIPAAQDLARVLDEPTEALPDHIVPLWEASVRLASFLQMDKALLASRSNDPIPLPVDIHRALDDLVGSVAPFVRHFPSARDLDDARGASLANPALFAPAVRLFDAAKAEHMITTSASVTMAAMVQTAERGGVQGDKARTYAIRGARGLVSRGASYAAGFLAGAVASGYADQSPLIHRIGVLLARAEAAIADLVADRPADYRHAIDRLTRHAKQPDFPLGHSPAVVPQPRGVISPGSHDPEMVLIQPGTFLMGIPEAESRRERTQPIDRAARPQHRVAIAYPFLLGKYPVQHGEYTEFARDTNHLWSPPDLRQTDRHPAVNVGFADAIAYIDWLSRRTGHRYRLPSEAEWEYACRAGTTTARYWGDVFDPKRGNFDGIATTQVDAYPANPWGLFDMLGNVAEWVADTWHDSYRGAPGDGSAWITSDRIFYRVLRGGWTDTARSDYSRCGDRVRVITRYTQRVGFRLARTL